MAGFLILMLTLALLPVALGAQIPPGVIPAGVEAKIHFVTGRVARTGPMAWRHVKSNNPCPFPVGVSKRKWNALQFPV
jgi:hypothetical protein